MTGLAFYDVDKKRRLWLADLRAAEKRGRVLIDEDPARTLPLYETEHCVMCNVKTTLWLQPENTPLCGHECLDKYLEDPSVYDPRGLHTLKVIVPPKVRARKKAPSKRWEPSDADILRMQGRIRDEVNERRKKREADSGKRRRETDGEG